MLCKSSWNQTKGFFKKSLVQIGLGNLDMNEFKKLAKKHQKNTKTNL